MAQRGTVTTSVPCDRCIQQLADVGRPGREREAETMSQSNAGIQRLLDAEKKASVLVTEARKRKAQKLKTAKKEADGEINKLKGEKENQFKSYENELFSKKGNSEAQIQVQTNQKLKDQEHMLKNNQSRTMKAILEQVFNIEIRLHENVRC